MKLATKFNTLTDQLCLYLNHIHVYYINHEYRRNGIGILCYILVLVCIINWPYYASGHPAVRLRRSIGGGYLRGGGCRGVREVDQILLSIPQNQIRKKLILKN